MTDAVLVVAAHPDDELLGCGGTMLKLSRAGRRVNVVIMAEGLTSRDVKRDSSRRATELNDLAAIAIKANEMVGATVELLGFPDNRMDSVDRLDITKRIEEQIAKHKPRTVFTHHPGDVNIDHRQIFDAVVAACRPMPGSSVKELYMFEVASSTEWQPPAFGRPFEPQYFVDISSELPDKLKALECYTTEMRPWPHPRSLTAVEHLARWRGATVGIDAAEAFAVGRIIR
jgi:LmbE family N-acetylglucosaminyl deacetylase